MTTTPSTPSSGAGPVPWLLAGPVCGAVWLTAISLAFGPFGSRWTAIAAAYVLAGSLLLAPRGRRRWRAAVLAVVAVALWAVLLAPLASLGPLLVAAMIMATLTSGAWYVSAVVAVALLSGEIDEWGSDARVVGHRRTA